MKEKDLPRLLIISEATLCQSAGGAKQTLYNLFADYPPEKIAQLVPVREFTVYPPEPPFDKQVIAFDTEFVPAHKNRIGAWLNPLRTKLNLSLLQLKKIAQLQAIQNFDPELLLICPIGSEGLILGENLARETGLPFLVYFMDNWMEEKDVSWLGGSVRKLTNQLLRGANGWLMISEPLQKILSDTYGIPDKPCLIVHNPVDLKDEVPTAPPASSKHGEITIAYAGSIWGMHYDAMVATAEAIYQLRQAGMKIRLLIYSSQAFWELYKSDWQRWEVTYGGHIKYSELQHHLRKADFFLLAAAFDKKYKPYSESSVQTKITDYLAAGRPIISVGPVYSAGHYFLDKHQCGFIINSPEPGEIAEILRKLIVQKPEQEQFIAEGKKILEEKFNAKHVRKELYNYIYKKYKSGNRAV